MRKRLIIGTAGHIDHGKTTLLKALTGIDCDRWEEEKSRGITIDIGFAHLDDGDLQIDFIDVPGHERFLHNALAGLSGISLMLLVVAADEGVKPQTREHLAICSLLGLENGIVVLTKKDLVEPELLELAELEIAELLDVTPFSGSPIVAVSSTTGDGIPELKELLIAEARRYALSEDRDAPFRLPIDRAFQLRGLGAVVTGTSISGHVEAGDSLSVLPAGKTARVRSVHVHGSERQRALAGERTALQLTGVELGDLERGAQLVSPATFKPSKTLCARLTLLADAPEALTSFVPIRLHLYASEIVGKLRPLGLDQGEAMQPGETRLVEIRLSESVVAARGDRFIVRRPSPAMTLGGGEILDPLWRRRRGKPLLDALQRLEAKALILWVEETGERGLAAEELAPRVGRWPQAVAEELDHQVAKQRLLKVMTHRGPRYLSPAVCQRVFARARKVLADYFSKDRLASGVPKAEFLARILPQKAMDLAETYLSWLTAEKVLAVTAGEVSPPGRAVDLTQEESQLSQRILAAIEGAGLTPPSPGELMRDSKPQILDGVVRYLVQQGKLVKLPSGLILSAAAIADLRQALIATGWDELTVAEFKDRFELSRKWAIPLLEHLDSIGATRRVGDKRQVVKSLS